MNHPLLISALLPLLTATCSSGQFTVADADLYSDKHKLAGKYLQLVETQSDKTADAPAAERYARNCAAAEAAARTRFKSLYPALPGDGKRLGERFERNAGCTVRMAFKTE